MTTAMVKQELAVASFSTVYDLEQVETALSDLNESASDALRATYEDAQDGQSALLREAEPDAVVRRARRGIAQFAEPLEDVRKQVALCLETEDRLELMPILLLGPRASARRTSRRRSRNCSAPRTTTCR